MKKVLLGFLFLVFTNAVWANPIQIETAQKPFRTFNHLLSSDVRDAGDMLRVYMEDSMGCSRVRLELNILKEDGFFSKGIYTLSLTADCNSSIGRVELDFDAICTNGDSELFLKYSKSGRTISKRFTVENSESCQE